MEVSGQLHAPAALPPKQNRWYLLSREQCGPHRLSELSEIQKIPCPCWESNTNTPISKLVPIASVIAAPCVTPHQSVLRNWVQWIKIMAPPTSCNVIHLPHNRYVSNRTHLCTVQLAAKSRPSFFVTIVYYFIFRMTQRKNGYSMSRAMATLRDLSIVNSTYQDRVLCLCFTKCKPSHVECSNNSVNGKWNTLTVLENEDSCTRTDKSRYAVGLYRTTEGKTT